MSNRFPSQTSGLGRRASAFTLVELLVVIGIIAVLISILLPALNTARRQANTVKCLSNLRQVGTCFMLYARDYKGAMPLVRGEKNDGSPAFGPDTSTSGTDVGDTYWTDWLMPYFNKNAVSTGTPTQAQFDAARKSVFWGCTNWSPPIVAAGFGAQYSADDGGYVKVFETGYSMNPFPTYKPGHPADPYALVPRNEWLVRSNAMAAKGKYHKISSYTMPAQRLLVADANLWLLLLNPTDANGTIAPPPAGRYAADANPALKGLTNIDRWRHSRTKPPVRFGTYQGVTTNKDINTGRDAFNILYADFHASTVNDIREGYKAIRMRYP
jgi:prepilin-type N-terminal cleavage/methylation domain-containing protein